MVTLGMNYETILYPINVRIASQLPPQRQVASIHVCGSQPTVTQETALRTNIFGKTANSILRHLYLPKQGGIWF